MGGLGTMAALFSTGSRSIEAGVAAAGSVYGGVQTLWGRWAAKVPLPTHTDAEALAHNNAVTGAIRPKCFGAELRRPCFGAADLLSRLPGHHGRRFHPTRHR